MCKIIFLLSLILTIVTSVEAASLNSGTYPVDVYQGDRTYKTNWMLRVEGQTISGMSDWKGLYGLREYVQPLKGSITDNRVTITRNCSEPELISCNQTYSGTISNNQIEGSWSGTGGSGTWKMFFNRPLN